MTPSLHTEYELARSAFTAALHMENHLWTVRLRARSVDAFLGADAEWREARTRREALDARCRALAEVLDPGPRGLKGARPMDHTEAPETRVLEERRQTARRPHTCTGCAQPIERGERYTRYALVSDGRFETSKLHARPCWERR